MYGNLGRNMVESKNYPEFLKFLNSFPLTSYTLFEGTITNKEEREISGFNAGKITICQMKSEMFLYLLQK